jgi:glucose-6-phosphate isomerase
MDNIDPGTFERLFQNVAPEKTGFIVISKSGDTAETMTQFLYCLDIFRNALEENLLNQHFTVITEPGERPLRRLAEHFEIDIIDHDPGVGGRFSALSPVGMLPALIVGLEASELRAGALSVLQPVLEGISASEFAPAIGAALNIGLAKKCGVGATVIMPYLDQLTSFGLWFRQLWAESLGKSGEGTTPINALGTVDQHSQLQLYLDGPKDKMFTLVFSRVAQSGGIVPEDLADSPDLSYLAGRRMGDLLEAEQQATARTLINKNRPTRIITIDRLDEQTLGALMMHFMLETIVAADLLGVNAFDQPAVENGKILAKEYLTKMTEK